MTSQKPMLSIDQALTLLARMQAAAPAATAGKLGEIAALLQSLSHDNAYLVGLYGEALILPVANDGPAPAPLPAAAPATEAEAVLGENDVLLLQLEEALRPRLSAVQALVEPLAGSGTSTLSPELKATLRQIRDHNRAAQAMLDGVEMVIALQQGLLDVTTLIFSANMLLREVERQAQERTQSREQVLEVTYPDSELKAVGDYQRVLVILLDLIDNASRYTPRGGHIRVKAESLGTHVLFSVDDNGIGLRPEDEAHVGEPFWRAADQPLVRQHPGTGLRLYLAAQLLALQAGELVFSGDAEMGSTFSFMLPAP